MLAEEVKLTTAHQVLIVSFIALGALFALRSLWLWQHGGGVSAVLLAGGGVAVSVAASLYLRHFRKRLLERRGSSG
jgi:hypothetical protein